MSLPSYLRDQWWSPASDEGAAEVRFRRKVVVNARRADSDTLGEVAVAERVVPARLCELLRGVEQLIDGSGSIGESRHEASLPSNR